jgi:nucleoside-diphosphate-sugar epimerase
MKTVAIDSRAWGKAWHVPSNEAKTQKELIEELAWTAGAANPKISSVPSVVWNLLAIVNPLMRELKETAYQMERPYILDDSAARKEFGMQPTDWNQILQETVSQFLEDNK